MIIFLMNKIENNKKRRTGTLLCSYTLIHIHALRFQKPATLSNLKKKKKNILLVRGK